MMERVTFKNSRKLTLVGHLYPSTSESIIIMCHGFMSSKYSKGRFEKLATAFNKSGHSALLFDFSGCGESDDDILTVEKEVDDLKSAIQFVKSKGYLTEYTPQEVRKKIVIDKRILEDFELINQKELLEDVNCPVLIIHGNNDEEEKLLYERSKTAMTLLSSDSKLEVIDGANHSFLEHFHIVIKLTTEWFIKHFY